MMTLDDRDKLVDLLKRKFELGDGTFTMAVDALLKELGHEVEKPSPFPQVTSMLLKCYRHGDGELTATRTHWAVQAGDKTVADNIPTQADAIMFAAAPQIMEHLYNITNEVCPDGYTAEELVKKGIGSCMSINLYNIIKTSVKTLKKVGVNFEVNNE